MKVNMELLNSAEHNELRIERIETYPGSPQNDPPARYGKRFPRGDEIRKAVMMIRLDF